MTDYFDESTKQKSAPAKVVTATLAGVLAAGMMPAVALAAPQEATTTDDGFEMLATDADTIKAGSLVLPAGAQTSFTAYYKPGSTTSIAQQGPDITQVQPAGTGLKPINITELGTGFTNATLWWFPVSQTGVSSGYTYPDGKPVMVTATTITATKYTTTKPSAPGTYAIVLAKVSSGSTVSTINSAATQLGVEKATIITIEAASLDGASVFEWASSGSSTSDTTFMFNNAAYSYSSQTGTNKFGVAMGGKALGSSQVSVSSVQGVGATGTSTGKYAGKYTVYVDGAAKSIYKGNSTTLTLTIDPVNLADYTFTLAPQTIASAANHDNASDLLVNGAAITSSPLKDLVTLLTTTPPESYPSLGTYNVGVAAKPSAGSSSADKAGITQSIIGTATASYPIVANATPATFSYAGKPFSTYSSASKAYPVNLSKGESFDPANVTASATNDPVPSSAITLTVYNAKGENVGSSVPSTPGTYTVVASVNASAVDNAYAGTSTMYVTVVGGSVKAADIVVSVNGTNLTATAKNVATYNGESWPVIVSSTSGVLPEGALKVTVTQTSNGTTAMTPPTVVSEAVNAGTYKVDIESGDWTITSGSFASVQFKIKQIDVKGVNISNFKVTTMASAPNWTLDYQGAPLDLLYTTTKYTRASDDAPWPPLADYFTEKLPADAWYISAYTTVSGTNVSADSLPAQILEPGTYSRHYVPHPGTAKAPLLY